MYVVTLWRAAASLRSLLTGFALIELSGPVCRALEPWPRSAPDARRAALGNDGLPAIEFGDLARYDNRLLAVARALGIPLAALWALGVVRGAMIGARPPADRGNASGGNAVSARAGLSGKPARIVATIDAAGNFAKFAG